MRQPNLSREAKFSRASGAREKIFHRLLPGLATKYIPFGGPFAENDDRSNTPGSESCTWHPTRGADAYGGCCLYIP